MAFLEICAVANAGKVLCESCYMVEGDSCLILRAESIFQRIEKTIENGCFFPTLNGAVDKTLQCIMEERSTFIAENDITTADLARISEDVTI